METHPAQVPEKPSLEGLEAKWAQHWESEGTYRFDRTKTRDEVYSIDTPPPTVSGSLHVGHVFSYTHTDTIARYKRMCGREVFYPMGWDDNGLPTERRVQNYFGVRCDPHIAYDSSFTAPEEPSKNPIAISRPNFIELCHQLTVQDEKAFEELWRTLGLSVDWTMTYATINERARRISQRALLRLIAGDHCIQIDAPTLWDVDFGTAVAQAELEDREVAGAYHSLKFAHAGGWGESTGHIVIETTRPELLPACVALVANPDDERYKPFFGRSVRTPLFGVEVPVVAHRLADPEKGSGIAMVCTFGDTTDVIWWRELGLDLRTMLGRDGRILLEPPDGVDGGGPYGEIAGKTVKQAQTRIVEMLRESGDLLAEPRQITHAVKFFEKGDRPLEIVTSRQWFIKVMPLKDALVQRGRQMQWQPEHMRVRYETWVEGLNSEWCVSRQRYFGVPIPLWYPVKADGTVNYDDPILPPEDSLPVDPFEDVPVGYTAEQRGQPGGFAEDPDVMDTWATSSLTPQIAGGWGDDDDLFARVFPMDLRPQAHEIIRTWLFTTVVRSHLEHDSVPFTNALISGWVLDPDRKKMSKSKGNVVTPLGLLEQYGSDAVRYWAARGRPGVDTAFDEGQMKVGRRLAIKLLNASRFVLSIDGPVGEITEALDKALMANLAILVDEATAAFDSYDYSRALERTEKFFWTFCDDYLELVKIRAYGEECDPSAAASALGALRSALTVFLRLFAPHMPFVTEEAWSWWQEGSVHKSPWPKSGEFQVAGADPLVLEVASRVIAEVRKAKTDAQRSQRASVESVTVRAGAAELRALDGATGDLRAAGSIGVLNAVPLDQTAEMMIEVLLDANQSQA